MVKNKKNIDQIIEKLLSDDMIDEVLPLFHGDFFNINEEIAENFQAESVCIKKEQRIIDKKKLIQLINEKKIEPSEVIKCLESIQSNNNGSLCLYRPSYLEMECTGSNNDSQIIYLSNNNANNNNYYGIDFKVDAEGCIHVDNAEITDAVSECAKNRGGRVGIVIDCTSLNIKLDAGGMDCLKDIIGLIYEINRLIMKSRSFSRVVFVVVVSSGDNIYNELFKCLAGLFKTLTIEDNRVSGKIIDISLSELSLDTIIPNEIGCEDSAVEIIYQNKTRKIQVLERCVPDYKFGNYVKKNGVYVLTGGNGKIARIIAQYLADNGASKIILIVRRDPAAEEKSFAESLGNGVAEYIKCDMTQKNQISKLVNSIISKYGYIDGIYHCAGKICDSMAVNKKKDLVNEVLSPKMDCLVNLYHALLKADIGFLMLCSSLAAVTGNLGQSDYGAANYFMDKLAQIHMKSGHKWDMYSINWPLWKDGGMHVDEERAEMMVTHTGMLPMPSSAAILVMDTVTGCRLDTVAVMYGRENKINENLKPVMAAAYKENTIRAVQKDSCKTVSSSCIKKIDFREYFSTIMFDIAQLGKEELDFEAAISEYGIDSIMLGKISERLSADGYSISQTLLYEAENLGEIVSYLEEKYADEASCKENRKEEKHMSRNMIKELVASAFADVAGLHPGNLDYECPFNEYGMDSIMIQQFYAKLHEKGVSLPRTALNYADNLDELVELCLTEYISCFANVIEQENYKENEFESAEKEENIQKAEYLDEEINCEDQDSDENISVNAGKDIAIIGIDIRVTGSEDVTSFWNNIYSGKAFISEVPANKWDHNRYFSENKDDALKGKTYCRYGAFLEESDKFDSQFFHISPKEAEIMDPQERILLESVWHALEDANYTKNEIKHKYKNKAGVGVFVGSTHHSYALTGIPEWQNGNPAIPSSWQWAFANRISYEFDFSGPSLPVDTGCSSSLTALYLACSSIQNCESDMAVVSGVNLYSHPSIYVGASKLQLLSSKKEYHIFSDDCDGFIPGEGVATILIKSLDEAVKDNDKIYGIIKGVGINHTGNTNTFFAPNKQSEEKLIINVADKADLSLDTISYIEAGSTGAPLGDLIEMHSLTSAFERSGATRNGCAIGSVKQNIGHLESASSLAAIIKILLQFKHNKICPNLFSRNINTEINFDRSPFYLAYNREDFKISAIPKRALVNAVSAGGTNACVILEEYRKNSITENRSFLTDTFSIRISAKTRWSLDEYVKHFYEWLKNESNISLDKIERALIHRDIFEYKAEFRCSGYNELIGQLKDFINNRSEKYLVNKFEKVDSNRINPIDINLPGYKFERPRYWITDKNDYFGEDNNSVDKISNMLDKNNSRLGIQCFTKKFTGEEFFIRDHLSILPAVAYIELIYSAVSESVQSSKLASIKNLVLVQPYHQMDNHNGVCVSVIPKEEELQVEVCSNTAQKTLFARCTIELARLLGEKQSESMEKFNRLKNGTGDAEAYYRHLDELNSCFGSRFKGINEIWFEDSAAFIKAKISSNSGSYLDYNFHPVLLDSGFQSVVALAYNLGTDPMKIYMPFVIENIKFYEYDRTSPIAYVRASIAEKKGSDPANYKYNLEYFDEIGSLVIQINNYSIAPVIFDREQKGVFEPVTEIQSDNLEFDASGYGQKQADFKIEEEIEKICRQIINLKTEINHTENLLNYGFESISITELSNKINSLFGIDTTPVFFFENNTITRICEALKNYISKDKMYYKLTSIKKQDVSSDIYYIEKLYVNREKYNDRYAIIGISGAFPGSRDVDEFWRNISDRKVLIKDIPKERWDWRKYEDAYCHTGGFIDGVDEFDAKFFGISPSDADFMDPQQRLVLEHVWNAMEDAGYSSKDLSGTNTSIYVGVSNADYGELLVKSGIPTVMTHSMVTNRVSFFLDITGKSEPCDAACASSLVAISKAIETLKSGESDMAFAGGVNLLLSPSTYVYECMAKALSLSGVCHSFDKDADGYVRGEGIGIILIKRLEDAVRDGDPIYAAICGVSVGHAGKSSGLTVPKAAAQAKVIEEAYRNANFDLSTVSYIEAHGTGTKLGDPIEIDGLNLAYENMHPETEKIDAECVLSSVKTNIGHLEAASGIAGLIKVIKAMKNKVVPPVADLKEINPYINLKNSRFCIPEKETEFKQFIDAGSGDLLPRRAGISSFGIGGVNAHIAVEEYLPDQIGRDKVESPFIFVASAKSKNSLTEYLKKICKFVNQKRSNNPDEEKLLLADLCYTLQVARDSFNVRYACIMDNIDMLIENINGMLSNNTGSKSFFCDNIMRFGSKYAEEHADLIDELSANKDYAGIAQEWVKGAVIDWEKIRNGRKLFRIHIPTYAFAKDKYWYTQEIKSLDNIIPGEKKEDGNSTGYHFTNSDEVLCNHIINNARILPGAMFAEFAFKAANKQRKQNVLFDLVWLRNIDISGGEADVTVKLNEADGGYSIDIFSDKKLISCKTRFEKNETTEMYLDVNKYKNSCGIHISKTDLYSQLKANGVCLGPMFNTIARMSIGKSCSVCDYEIDGKYSAKWQDALINPLILDAGFQSVGMLSGSRQENGLRVPFYMKECCIYSKPEARGKIVSFLHKVKETQYEYHIFITDNEGRICVQIKEFCVKKA
jgi:acyl transferase domain-containing protein